MAKLPEITSLFAKLASNLDPIATNEPETTDLSISILTQSLNLTPIPRVRVLDTALSLMCFTAPQVFDEMNESLMKSIITVLSSSVECKMLRYGKEKILRVGGLISSQDCVEVIEACTNVLGNLERHGMLSCSLLYAVVRVAISASSYQYALHLPLTPILDLSYTVGRTFDFSKLLVHLPKELPLKSQEIPLRLLLWYLDPLILKHDVSAILHDATKMPFLRLSTEFYERLEWRSICLCLVASPAVFIEARALLHNWLLASGLASVLEVQTELVAMVLDVISRPMWWGIMEVGSELPFSQAYFPKHQLLRILTGPLSCENLLLLVSTISKLVPHTRRDSDPTLRQIGLVDHKSMWAMTMNFPDWFFFGCAVLFSRNSAEDNFHSKCVLEASEAEQSQDVELPCSVAAARYIAWILNPISKSHEDLLVNCLRELSLSLTLKQLGLDKHDKATSFYKKECMKQKFPSKEDRSSLKYDCQRIFVWLKDFHETYASYCEKAVYGSASMETKTSRGFGPRHSVLLRKVPLGILIGSCDDINEEGCELLLHYAATGTMHEPMDTQNAGSNQRRCHSEQNLIMWTKLYNEKEAVAGARQVFHLTDTIENMSTSIFETDDISIEFIGRVKLKCATYLLNCVNRILQHKTDVDDGETMMLRDLYKRLVQWKHQGRDVFQGNKDMDDTVDALMSKLSSL